MSTTAALKPKLLPKPGSVKVVKAVFSYEAQTDEELTFKEGDILYVSEQSADGWWTAKFKGKTGLIPYNYVADENVIKEPLHDAVRRGNTDFLKECLSNRVSTTGLDIMGNTPIYWAAHSGHLDCLEILLSQANPPINATNRNGDTALHVAAARGHIDVVKTLLSNAADSDIKNNQGETALDLAMNPGVKNVIQLSKQSRNSCSASFNPEEYEDDSE